MNEKFSSTKILSSPPKISLLPMPKKFEKYFSNFFLSKISIFCMGKIEILKGKRESQGKKRIFLYEYD
jgi:hypothetical protein